MKLPRRKFLTISAAALLAPVAARATFAQTPPARITVLYDAFGKASNLKRGWGFAALVEYGGRRVLFDTGAKAADLAYNVDALGIDLKKLDFVVISHRHNDHTAGLHYVLRENPGVAIYTPVEGAAFDLASAPAFMNLIKRYVASVPDELRYFGGTPPSEIRYEPPWAGARFVQIRETTEVLPGMFLFSTRSETPGTREMNEIALVIKTPKGNVLVVGCSHPGIEKMLETVIKIDPQIYSVFGGFHLVDVSDDRVTEIVSGFRDKWKIERMAAGHCTGQFAFAELVRIYAANFDHAGVGSIIALPS
jgi:7,8-dihydropterin-6-yl-methyl-4-(beta-D-ribofuranosyl)aminobenzene 5'-phosphate synthase